MASQKESRHTSHLPLPVVALYSDLLVAVPWRGAQPEFGTWPGLLQRMLAFDARTTVIKRPQTRPFCESSAYTHK